MSECTCACIKVGTEITTDRNWNPDCERHGVKSDWFKSPLRHHLHKWRDGLPTKPLGPKCKVCGKKIM